MQTNKKITLTDLNENQKQIADEIIEKVSKLLSMGRGIHKLPLEERIFSISGKSGSGKSTLTSVLVGELKKLTSSIKLTCPTHKALAVLKEMANEHQLQASTIHSHLGCKIQENYSTGKQDLIVDPDFDIEPLDIICCDELSMVGDDLYQILEPELLNGNFKIAIFIGDSAQLKPVGANENPIYEGIVSCQEYELTEIVRQAEDSNIIQIASHIRSFIEKDEFIPFEDIVAYIEDYVEANKPDDIEIIRNQKEFIDRYVASEYDDNLAVAFKNKTVDSYNRRFRELLKGKKIPYIMEGEQLVFNEAHFVGDEQVHANNEIVTIKSCEQHEDELHDLTFWKVIDTEERPFRIVDRASLMDYEYELSELAREAKKAKGSARSALWQRFFELKKTFQDVKYTYACTVHKSQGSTTDVCYIDLNELLQAQSLIGLEQVYRLLYVSATRCKHKVVFFIR